MGRLEGMARLRITITDDHQIIRVGLRAVLEAQPDLEVVGEAETLSEGLALITREQPDVAILDLNLPDGIGLDSVPQIRNAAPNTRILVLTMHSERDLLRRSIELGVQGFLNKVASPDEVVSAVRAVAAGRALFSIPVYATESKPAPRKVPRSRAPDVRALTERERQILGAIARGLSQREIADELGVSVKTVETYRGRLGDKFGARRRDDLILAAVRAGVIHAERTKTPSG
jgi:DNA-binding NarL/FixJ family response regulator